MERQKRWQSVVIIAVILLTIYNILPTIFFYTKSLNEPIGDKKAVEVAHSIVDRVNDLEQEAVSWIKSFNKLLKIKANSIAIDADNPQFIHIKFSNDEDAKHFSTHIPRAGALIPFVPSQLSLVPTQVSSKHVTLQRNIPIQFNSNDISNYFEFSTKLTPDGNLTPTYQKIIDDRAIQLGLAIGGISENAQYVEAALNQTDPQRADEFLHLLTQSILSYTNVFGENSSIAKRYYATFTQGPSTQKSGTIDKLASTMQRYQDRIRLERISLQDQEKKIKEKGGFLESVDQQKLDYLSSREEKINQAVQIIKRQKYAFSSGSGYWDYQDFTALLNVEETPPELQKIDVGTHNPLIDSIEIDWQNEKIQLTLHQDILNLKKGLLKEKNTYVSDQLDQLIYNEIARIARESGEAITPFRNTFEIELNQLTDSQSFLTLKLSSIAEQQAAQLISLLNEKWNPAHADLRRDVFPIWDYETYQNLSPSQKKLGLLIYAPASLEDLPPQGFRTNSVYVVAKGAEQILAKLRNNPDSPQAKAFLEDFRSLSELLRQNGFYGYSGNTFPLSTAFSKDYIFEAEDFYQNILNATREDFTVHGTKKFAVLEFTDVKQRILTLNRIETQMHEDLLKWRDEYQSTQVDPSGQTQFEVPAPTKNILLNNLKLSFVKYFRGDERKILHWGLDLSGGKTVQIELRDSNNRVVKDEADIKQGINELYNRVNKMGVSEVTIRQEGSNITLDFPSAQGLSAAELVKASSMYFNVVNEKFTPNNPTLKDAVNRFLQEVWNEAVVTNRKEVENINQIAWNHLYGDTLDSEIAKPKSEAAKILFDNGLRLSSPQEQVISNAFNDSISKIALFRGDSFTDWQDQTHPLIVIFKNYALEGSNLDNVHASYDPSKGNFLSFQVKSSQVLKDKQKINPRNELHTWTANFAKENIGGTPLEKYSQGRGWRMAVILNGTIISSPGLDSPLRDSAMITGSFTQREVNRLESDLKAGSLTFAPHILSEKNVSPELGLKDRYMGILATIIALVLVIALMVGYYRFSGIVASVAVIFNLLIIWATLQNIQATITLANLAGIILTLGMAVDANVLVFERIREEFNQSGRIASAVRIGYRKAFSAIFDSNITTIIAAVILLNFDSGPIKGFAITLIIGIVSSMFTALFMTRYFFTGWVKNKKNQSLKMANLIRNTKYNFLKFAKPSIGISLVVILAGAYLLISQRATIFGMDFTGGFSLNLQVEAKKDEDYRSLIEKALIANGITAQDFQAKELSPANNIKLLLGKSLDQSGKPFYDMPLETDHANVEYAYQNNPRILWVVNALQSEGVILTGQSLNELAKSWTSISGQMSDSMRNNALIGLGIALLCILAYITIRFEFKYAVSATLGLAFDVFVTLGIVGILHALRVPVQIDLNTVAALMTIIGYSLNDTIIIFDRIRENLKSKKKQSFKEIINQALNTTLSRTLMTSGTTLIVLLSLVTLGGSSIFGLALVMIIGVVYGTLSSLFIAAPLLLFFQKKEEIKQEKLALNER